MCIFFFNDTATTEIYTLSLHDALPIWPLDFRTRPLGEEERHQTEGRDAGGERDRGHAALGPLHHRHAEGIRSEEHTSELQSRQYLVCRLLLEKKKSSKN